MIQMSIEMASDGETVCGLDGIGTFSPSLAFNKDQKNNGEGLKTHHVTLKAYCEET